MNSIEDLKAIIKAEATLAAAQLYKADINSSPRVQKITLNLATAQADDNPLQISVPFKCIAVKNATGGTGSVRVKFDRNDSGLSLFTMDNNDIITNDSIFDKAFLSWDAQSGKTIDVYLFLDSEYKSGSLINSGTIAISPSSALAQGSVTTVATTNVTVVAQNTLRKRVHVSNNTGDDIWIKGAATGTTIGRLIPSGESQVFETTAAIVAYPLLSATDGISYLEEI